MPPELEAKVIAPEELRLPDLNGLVKGATAVQRPSRHLEAVYFDTPELRLARNGITLRYRTGEDGPPWTVKLPEGSSRAVLRRREVSFDDASGPLPPQAADLVRAYTRSRPLVPVARLHTDRTPLEIRDPDGGPLAEITDDRGAVYDEHGQRTGGFREVEAEVRADGLAGGRLLRAAVGRAQGGRLPGRAARPHGDPGTRPASVRATRCRRAVCRGQRDRRRAHPLRNSPVSGPDAASRPWGSPRRGSRRCPSVPRCHPQATA